MLQTALTEKRLVLGAEELAEAVGTGVGHRGVSKEGFVNGDWKRGISKVGFANGGKGFTRAGLGKGGQQREIGKGGLAKGDWGRGISKGRLGRRDKQSGVCIWR